jgi:hypothetical protein
MLITINGEADNGKDYTADWLCARFGLVKVALADPMKRFLRQLFGFPVDNLWGPSEKRNEELPSQPLWDRAFQQLHTLHQFTAAVVPETLGVDIRVKAFEGLQKWFTALRKRSPETLSARVSLQTLGTEWGRTVTPTMWLDYLFGTQLPLLVQGYPYTAELGVRTNLEPEEPKAGVCIPDQRFLNELEAIEGRGGYSIRVRRLSRVKTDGSNVGIQGHQSEQEQKGIPDNRFSQVFNFPEGLDAVNAILEAWATAWETG